MARYEVYQGPGQRIVAISLEPMAGVYTVRQGTQGTTLRVTTAPATRYPSRDALKAALLSPDYVLLFTGEVDPQGFHRGSDDDAAVGWIARNLDLDHLRLDLTDLVRDLRQQGVDVTLRHDAAGCVMVGARWRFGITTAATPNCVFARTKSGQGTVFLDASAELIAGLCVLSLHHPFAFCEASSGAALTRTQVVDRVGNRLTPSLASFVRSCGIASLRLLALGSPGPKVHF
jgi:hypothetical protein